MNHTLAHSVMKDGQRAVLSRHLELTIAAIRYLKGAVAKSGMKDVMQISGHLGCTDFTAPGPNVAIPIGRKL